MKRFALGLALLLVLMVAGCSAEPTLTPIPAPTATAKPTPVPMDEGLRTIRSKASGILFEVPASWKPVQTGKGLQIQGEHGDVFFANLRSSFTDFFKSTDAYITSINQYSENERTVLDDKVVSKGFFGNAYREFVFFENGLGRIALISFTVNPEFLDEYMHIFEKIEASLKITPVNLNESETPSTVTPTATPTLTPTVLPATTNQPVMSPDKETALDYFGSNELELAIENINRHIKLYPRDTSAYIFRGVAHTRLEKFRAALDDFNIVLTLPSTSTDPVEVQDEKRNTYQMIAYLYWELDLLQDSFDNLGNFLQVDEKTITASEFAPNSETQKTIKWLIDGINYLDSGLYGKAIESFTEFIDCTWTGKPPEWGSMPEGCTEQNYNIFITWQSESEHPIGYFYRGVAYKKLGDLQKATSDFTKVIELDPDNSRGFSRKATDAGFVATPTPTPTATPIPAPSLYTRTEAVKALEDYLDLREYVASPGRPSCLWVMQTRGELQVFYEPNDQRWLIESDIEEGKRWPVMKDVPLLKWYFHERTGAIESIVATSYSQLRSGC